MRALAMIGLAMVWLVAAGCTGPSLASRPMTDEEMEWTSIIRASYPGWRPPHFTTVTNQNPDVVPVAPASDPASSRALQPVPAAPSGQIELVPAEPSR